MLIYDIKKLNGIIAVKHLEYFGYPKIYLYIENNDDRVIEKVINDTVILLNKLKGFFKT